jgi:hypothetical protein
VFDSTGALIGARSGKSTSAEARFISAEQAVAIAAAFPAGSVGTLVEVTPYVQKTATGIVFSGACEYAGYDVVAVTASPTITIYDGTDTSGAVILPATTMTVGRFERTFKLQLLVGCYIVISGTATVNMLVG